MFDVTAKGLITAKLRMVRNFRDGASLMYQVILVFRLRFRADVRPWSEDSDEDKWCSPISCFIFDV